MAYVSEWEEHYGVVPVTGQGVGDRFAHVLEHIHNTTGKRSVVLIDEYDKPLLDVLDTGYRTKGTNGEDILIEEYNRNILKGFYSTFKAADAHLQFVLLTGVTKFSQVSVFSGFNQPADISMDRRFEALCGITKDEMEEVFHDVMDDMAAEQGVSPQEMREKLRLQYDGYHFGQRLTDIYNPFSVLNAFSKGELRDFWFASGTPTYLIRLLNHTHENLNDLTGKYYDVADFIDYKADAERPLPMIYQSGYLTIKAYDRLTGTFMLEPAQQRGEARFRHGHSQQLSSAKGSCALGDGPACSHAGRRRHGRAEATAYGLFCKHSLHHAAQGKRAGARALFPLYLLPAVPHHQHLSCAHREAAERGPRRLHNRNKNTHLYI